MTFVMPGRVLLNQSLERLDQTERDRYLKRLPSRYMATRTGRFFNEILLSLQPVEVQGLIIQNAVFKTIRPRVLEALFPDRDAGSIFESLAARRRSFESGRGPRV